MSYQTLSDHMVWKTAEPIGSTMVLLYAIAWSRDLVLVSRCPKTGFLISYSWFWSQFASSTLFHFLETVMKSCSTR